MKQKSFCTHMKLTVAECINTQKKEKKKKKQRGKKDKGVLRAYEIDGS